MHERSPSQSLVRVVAPLAFRWDTATAQTLFGQTDAWENTTTTTVTPGGTQALASPVPPDWRAFLDDARRHPPLAPHHVATRAK